MPYYQDDAVNGRKGCMKKAPPRKRTRTATAIRFQADIHDNLSEAAADRDVSINFLVNKAVAEFLDRLIPVDEMRWTRNNE